VPSRNREVMGVSCCASLLENRALAPRPHTSSVLAIAADASKGSESRESPAPRMTLCIAPSWVSKSSFEQPFVRASLVRPVSSPLPYNAHAVCMYILTDRRRSLLSLPSLIPQPTLSSNHRSTQYCPSFIPYWKHHAVLPFFFVRTDH
jgi:hypothetical protein